MNSIEDLLQDLKPVKRAPSTARLIVIWTLFCAVFLGLAFLIRQPLKPHTPIIIFVHLFLSLAAGALAIASASPHEIGISRRWRGLVFLWPIPVMGTLLILPTQPVWFFTLRCILASAAWTLPGMILMIWILRSGFVLRPFHSIMLASLAAASLGALAQNVACVELGGFHRLLSHVLPPALLSALCMTGYRFLIRFLKPAL
ncbi:MAG: DUF1109 family protein [Leptospirales bacterium]|nr:DUF1109 family protein [Leptospirales bacterium]